MKYSQGKIGRVLVARLDDGDDLLGELKKLADMEKLEAGIIYVIGALKDASLVVGPEECALPPVPVWRNFSDCREVIGVGNLFRDNGEPVIHLHGALGRGDATLMGCIRGEAGVFLVAEVIILELTGTGASREFDPATGIKMLNLSLS
ncbi:MAG: PPC domain-containing DNA-binding protein [Bacillota bacterium]